MSACQHVSMSHAPLLADTEGLRGGKHKSVYSSTGLFSGRRAGMNPTHPANTTPRSTSSPSLRFSTGFALRSSFAYASVTALTIWSTVGSASQLAPARARQQRGGRSEMRGRTNGKIASAVGRQHAPLLPVTRLQPCTQNSHQHSSTCPQQRALIDRHCSGNISVQWHLAFELTRC